MTSKQPNPNPYLNANKWSRLFHGWISQLLDKSHKQKTIHLDDLYDILPGYESADLTQILTTNWLHDLESYPTKPSLFRATVRTIKWQPLLIGCLLLLKKIAIIVQPLLIIYLMKFFEPCSTMPIQYAWFLVFLIVLTPLWSSFFHHRYFYSLATYSLRMRVAYHGLIYCHVLRLSSYSLNKFSSGEIMNIFSNDAGQIEMVINNLNYLWISPLEILIMIIFFWYYVRYVAFAAIGYTFFIFLLISLVSRLFAHLRGKILEITDERVKIMSEIIRSMRIIKMYCWESAFNRKIRLIRKHEIIRYISRLFPESIQLILSHTYVCITFLIMYGTMWLFNMPLDTRYFAVASCILYHLQYILLEFGDGVRHLVNYYAAAKRIQTFLLLEESQRDRRLLSRVIDIQSKHNHNTDQTSINKLCNVECDLYRAHWQQDKLFSLNDIHFDAQPGDLICIIGPVGSGKSSLLQSLTGEIAFFDGTVRLRGSFCYVPQESWIFSSTVKKNILFGKKYDAQLFRRVVHAAALEEDFAQLSHGANTLVGDQGVMLSGGQKARVNMARALYRDADIYLLDDPLSAVDVKVSKHLFERSIKSYLREKISILVTHQIQFLQDATKIIVLENGKMTETGTYKELLQKSASFRHLLEDIHQKEQQHQEKDHENEHTLFIRQRSTTRCTSVLENHQEEAPLVTPDNDETKEEGAVAFHVYIAYLRAGAGLIFGVIISTFIFGLREAASVLYSWWLAKWSDEESYRYQQLNNCSTVMSEKVNMIQSMNETEWVNYRSHRFYFYCGIAMVLLILSFIRIISMKLICLNSGRILHNKMFHRVIRCPISFFDLNPVGRILNRFTKDIAVIDENLPQTLFDFLECLFIVLGMVGLVCWLNPWALIPAIVAFIIMLFIRRRCTRCIRDLKRLDGTTRSPIYSYLTSTIHGLKVIRSYRAEKTCLSEFFSHVDDNTRANYLFIILNRWAGIRFDWITTMFVAIVTSMSVMLHVTGQQFTAADIALTLSYSLYLTGLLQWVVRQSVEIETQMTSVERVLEYCRLDQEPPAQVSSRYRPSPNWPSHGQIIFNNVCMSHSKDLDSPLALSHITLTIQSGEKVGIVGRTGAGKSSFIQTLFRMGTLTDGYIKIDDIDISTIGLDDLRRRISIIPQDPVLFTGTMRSNLDQFGDYSDAEIWYALEQVQLKKLVSDVLPNGLQSLVSESGSNLSVGQKQLVCLARAILKKCRILVIDEATANVDNATDELIQRSIREQFKECTVLTVAHRLRTVIDSDRIMVLGSGQLLEFDSPQVLLANPESQFTSLVEQTGRVEADRLRLLARNAELNSGSTLQKLNEDIEEELLTDNAEYNPLIL